MGTEILHGLASAIAVAVPFGLLFLISWPTKRKCDRVLLELCRQLDFPPQSLTWFEAMKDETSKQIEGAFRGFPVRVVVFPPRKRELRLAFARPLPGGLRILPRTSKTARLDRIALEVSGLGKGALVLANEPDAARACLEDERFREAAARFRSACPEGWLLSGEIVVPATKSRPDALQPILESMATLAEALPGAQPTATTATAIPPEPELASSGPSPVPLLVTTRNDRVEARAAIGSPLEGWGPVHALGPTGEREKEIRARFWTAARWKNGVAGLVLLVWIAGFVELAHGAAQHDAAISVFAFFLGLPFIGGCIWYVTPRCPVCGTRPGRDYPSMQIPSDCPTCGLRFH